MDQKQFNEIIVKQLVTCETVLCKKAIEYATEDRLHNFKVAAAVQGNTPRQALMGMMAKHTISIYDMGISDDDFSTDMWEEKITDHINYLLLLRAIVAERSPDEV